MASCLRIFAKCLSWLPPAFLIKLANFLVFLAFDLFRFRRRLVLKNLEIAFGQEKSKQEFKQIARASYRSFVLTCFEFLRGIQYPWTDQVEFENDRTLKTALQQGKGVFVLAIHMGNWEVMAAAVSRFICPAHVLVKKVGNDQVNQFVTELRQKNGFLLIFREEKLDGVRRIRKAMQAGEVVGFVMDQSRPGEPRIKLFGREAKTNTGLASLWLKNQAPIVPGISIRTGFNQHRVVFFPELDLPKLPYSKEAVIEITALFNQQIERMIRSCPEQYFWLHNRWK